MAPLLISMTLLSLVGRGEGFSYNPTFTGKVIQKRQQQRQQRIPTTTTSATAPSSNSRTNCAHQNGSSQTGAHNHQLRYRSSSCALLRESGGSGLSAASLASEEEPDNDCDVPIIRGGTSKISDAIFNLVKGIVGAGVLALPNGIAQFGDAPTAAIPAVFLICLIGCLSAYGFGLIGRVCSLTGTSSYREAWSASVSNESSWIPAWSVTLKTMFATLAYSMILRDTFTSLLLAAGFNVNRVPVLLTVTSTVLLPLCLLKNLSSLAPFSLLGSLGMIYTAMAMFIRLVDHTYRVGGKFAADLPESLQPSFGTVGASGVLTAASSILLGMLSTAFMAHFNAPKFFVELENNTIPRYMTVVTTSFSVSIVLFAFMAGAGFLTFGSHASGLILNNYSPRDPLMGFSKIAVALSLVFSFPLAFVGFRDGVLDLLKIKNKSDSFLNTFTVGILSIVTLLALFIEDVSIVLAFAGSTLGNSLIYIYPALMFRGAVRKLAQPTKLQKFEVKAALTSAAAGVIMGVVGVYSILKR